MNERRVRLFVFGAVFAVVLGVYYYSAAPTAAFWDCSELIAASFTMGAGYEPKVKAHMLSVHLTRVSGQRGNWMTVNQPFLEALRQRRER